MRWLLVLLLLAPTHGAELDILDEFLSQYDMNIRVDNVTVAMVQGACHRAGGAPMGDVFGTPTVGNNLLLIHHMDWHTERGGFPFPDFSEIDSDPYGREFLEFHREFIFTYTDWRAAHGHPDLPHWNPMQPIPAAFAYDVELPCIARDSENPEIPLPTYLTVEGGVQESPFWAYQDLCSIRDNNRLGKLIEASGYHADVHVTIGGDMREAGFSPKDPIFWAWHQHIESIHQEWQACGQGIQSGEDAPLPLWVPLLALLLVRKR